MKISIKLNSGQEMGYNSTFKSKAAFMQSPLWEFIKEGELSGEVKVTYKPTYFNEYEFKGADSLSTILGAATEKALVDEFA